MATIIVLEDDADLRQLLAEELEEVGHRVLQASSGVEGLAAIKAGNPDVIISDIGMPVMDGYQLRQRLETYPRFRSTPFSLRLGLGLSSGDRPGAQHRHRCVSDQAVDVDVLLSRIEAALLGEVDVLDAGLAVMRPRSKGHQARILRALSSLAQALPIALPHPAPDPR